MELPKRTTNQNNTNSSEKKVIPNISDENLEKATDKEPKQIISPDEIIKKKPDNGIFIPKRREEDELEMETRRLEKLKRGNLVKNIAGLLIFISLLAFTFFKVTLNEENLFLSMFGINNNLGLNHKKLIEKSQELEMSLLQLDEKIMSIEEKIKNKNYTLYSADIKKVRQSQLVWFDQFNKDKELELGIMDAPQRISDYFNDQNFQDKNNVIRGKHQKVSIKNLNASRKNISFDAETTQILGKIIFLDVEFLNSLTGLPIYKNLKNLNSFSREKNEDGDYSNTFSLNFDIQSPTDEDPQDKYFIDYLNWLKTTQPNLKIKNYSKLP